MTRKIIFPALFIIFTAAFTFSQNQITGIWKGGIDAMGNILKIEIKFIDEAGKLKGNIDIPQQGAKKLKLTNISADSGRVKFDLEIAPNNVCKFNGVKKDSIIDGNYSQMGITGTFYLKQFPETAPITETKQSSGLIEKEVTFLNGGIKLCGTLTIPDTTKKNPAIILITGSGAQNRDEEIVEFPIFKVIAEHMTKKGYAVLRYDDRGINCSEGNLANSTHEDFANDVFAGIEMLKKRNDLDASRIGLLGHSEGGIIASLCASKSSDVKFIILMASTGDNGSVIIKEQTKKIYKFLGKNDSEIIKEIEKISKLHNTIITDSGWGELKDDLLKQTKEKFANSNNPQYAAVENKDIMIQNIVESQIQGLKTPWWKSFLTSNPAEYLAKVKCPVLAIFGEKDFQVDAKNNSAKVTAALKKAGNKNVTIKTIKGANHLFQKAKTGAIEEYGKLDKAFIPDFLELISKWTLDTIK